MDICFFFSSGFSLYRLVLDGEGIVACRISPISHELLERLEQVRLADAS